MRFRSDPAAIAGSLAALVTPFDDAGALDLPGVERLVEWQLDQGSHGVTIGGSTSEPSAQTVEERAAVIDAVARVVADRAPFVAGTGCSRLEDTLALTAHARDAGADAVMVVTPPYARPTQQALEAWYLTVAREFPDLPVIAYNVPSRTAVDLAPETVERVFRAAENFVGVKETTREFEHFSRILHRCGPELRVWSGIELLCLPLLAIGGAGFISATANLAPAASARMYELWELGDLAGARRIHYGLHPLVDLLFVETNPAPAKHLMAERGLLGSGQVRPPLTPPTPSGLARIAALAAEGAEYLSPVPARPHRQEEP
ncbi:4-hydroxy-tetrahydrodipicolinate synthase [Nocardioides sp. GXZ039]|uniref:4-hydroxy-tetrahydrodipicolinate synthase n=1 Tax=Nocardioides sp. GXZ039 TaxID=3136018 RepID=UPI0030F37603